ncbi:MAG: QueT transporter family protein [Atopostipes sp.]|nr:QueT transporter family protein [Atopostipes sp.]
MKQSVRQLTLNAMIAAIYLVVAVFLPSYGPLQLRLAEMFAHLPVYNRKYSLGLVLGVALSNIRSSFGIYDVIFGTLHTILSLWIASKLIKEEDTVVKKMIINTLVFSVMSFVLALMVAFLSDQLATFWTLYGSFAASIALVMFGTIPLVLFLDKHIHFKETMDER